MIASIGKMPSSDRIRLASVARSKQDHSRTSTTPSSSRRYPTWVSRHWPVQPRVAPAAYLLIMAPRASRHTARGNSSGWRARAARAPSNCLSADPCPGNVVVSRGARSIAVVFSGIPHDGAQGSERCGSGADPASAPCPGMPSAAAPPGLQQRGAAAHANSYRRAPPEPRAP